MTFLLFVIFGLIEHIALLYICCSLFRFRASSYLFKFIIVGIPILSGNYLIRLEDSLSWLAPLFALIIFILLVRVFFEEVSFLWAATMAIVSTVVFGVVQSMILIVLTTTELTTFTRVQSHTLDSYIVQFLTSLIVFLIAHYLYKRGIGFTFSLERFKLIGENIAIVSILVAFLVAIGIIFYINDILIIAVVIALPFPYLIYFAIRKQREDAKESTFLE